MPEHERDVLEMLTLHLTGKGTLLVYEDALRTADWYDPGPARLTRILTSAMINKPHEQRARWPVCNCSAYSARLACVWVFASGCCPAYCHTREAFGASCVALPSVPFRHPVG